MTGPESELLRLGHFLGPQGVRGGVKLFVLGDLAQLRGLRRVQVEGRGWLRVIRVEPSPPGVALYLAGVGSREGAEALRGLKVYADEGELPAPEEGVYYYHELRGLTLRGPDGRPLGEVRDVLDSGHQDLLVVAHAAGEALVPLQAPYVVVELSARGRPQGLTLTADAPVDLLAADPGGPEPGPEAGPQADSEADRDTDPEAG